MLIIIFGLLFLLILRNKPAVTAFVYALGIWGFLVLAITESLSYFNALSTKGLWIAWGTIFLLLIGMYAISQKRCPCNSIKIYKDILKNVRNEKFIIPWGAFAIICMLIALKLTPFNWDTMTYRLPRIFHWAQNQSVAHYASNVERQISSPMFHEFTMLQAYVMYGTDRFVNMVQCFAYLISGFLVFNISRKISLSKEWSYFATILFYASPIAFAEGMTTQNDNYAAMWGLAFVYLVLDFMDAKGPSIKLEKATVEKVLILAILTGLAYLTKPNVCILIGIFAVGLLIVCIKRKDSFKNLAILLLMAIALAVLVILPEVSRNLITFDALLSSRTGARQLVGTLKPHYLLLNFWKVFTFNLPNPWIYGISDFIYKVAGTMSYRLGVPMNDATISEDCGKYQIPDIIQYGCDGATNPVVFILLIVCIVVAILIRKRIKENKFQNMYYILTAGAMLLFCVILRWEPYVSRYMIIFIGALCPGIAYILSQVLLKDLKKTVPCLTIILFMCFTTLFGCMVMYGTEALSRHRYSGYFNHDNQRECYEYWSCYVNSQGYSQIGLMTQENDYEYPLIRMLEGYERLDHVNVDNYTAVYEDQSFEPEVIIYIRTEWDQEADFKETITCHGNEYHANMNTINEMGCVYER